MSPDSPAHAGPAAGDDGGPTPLTPVHDLAAALGGLTCLPLPRPDPRSAAFGRSTLFFPLVGLGIGALLLALHRLLVLLLPRWLAAVGLVALWEAITGSASVLSGGAKLIAVGAPAHLRPAALLFAPLLARWGMVVLMVGARDAAAPAQKFNVAVTFREFAVTSIFAFAAVFAIAEAFGIVIVVSVAALTLGLRLLSHRRMRGVSWPFLRRSARLIETAVLLLCALL